jgi:hypothetical protein
MREKWRMIGEIEMIKFIKKAKTTMYVASEIMVLLSMVAFILCVLNGARDDAALYLGMAIFLKVCNRDG